MRIGVDARELEPHPTGVGRYLSELLTAWRQVPELDIVLYSRRRLAPGIAAINVVVRAPSGSTWLMAALPRRLLADRPDVFFGPAYVIPATPAPCAVTMHDLSWEVLPRAFPPLERVRRGMLARQAAVRAALVLCDSRSVAGDIRRIYRPAGLVAAVPLGVDPARFAATDATGVDELRTRLRLEPPVFTHVGSIFNRRRPELLIEALAPLLRDRGTLVFAGANRTYPRIDVDSLARGRAIDHRIRLLDYVDDTDLPRLLAATDLFLWPSDYEGFGLPPLEAMAAGVPVVASAEPSLVETLADGALLVDPLDAGTLRAAVERVLSNERLRRDLVAAGRRRAAELDWQRCASTTLGLLRTLGDDR